MTPLEITIEPERVRCTIDDHVFEMPIGPATLRGRELLGDPPRPEELTNAIGSVIDHLDDLVRERPDVLDRPVVLSGAEAGAIAAVEVGASASFPLSLDRSAVEEVFRTLATESATDRRHNPGLDPDLVDTVVAGCCIAVATMRRLHLDEITIVAAPGPGTDLAAGSGSA